MRSVDTSVKVEFIRSSLVEGGSTSSKESASAAVPWDLGSKPSSRGKDFGNTTVIEAGEPSSPTKRSRPRSRTFTFHKRDTSSKRDQSTGRKVRAEESKASSRPVSREIPRSDSSVSLGTLNGGVPSFPEDFVFYLKDTQKPQEVEVGKMHKLRLLLRNETVAWVDAFINLGGMGEVISLLYRIIAVEWREEHEDTLLHESLLCLKALCTTSIALTGLAEIQHQLFPTLLHLLFDGEKKGPSEFTTRGIVISLLITYISSSNQTDIADRSRALLSYLRDPAPDNQPLEFIAHIYQPRPYRVWCKEVVNVTKEVFWIFLHHLNVIALPPKTSSSECDARPYCQRHLPSARPPVPAAPYVGGVEWDATNYLACHLDLINSILAGLSSRKERNELRGLLKASGFEKCMGGSLRTCKEKFYGAVHDGLRTWVAAAAEDEWDTKEVREGPTKDNGASTRTSPVKGRVELAPKLEMPKLDLGSTVVEDLGKEKSEEGWL